MVLVPDNVGDHFKAAFLVEPDCALVVAMNHQDQPVDRRA